jgi:hypothetical protein
MDACLFHQTFTSLLMPDSNISYAEVCPVLRLTLLPMISSKGIIRRVRNSVFAALAYQGREREKHGQQLAD